MPQNAKSDENLERGGRRYYCVSIRLCRCACACVHFYSACMARGSCFRLQLVWPRNRSRILARGELGLQVAYGAGLGGK